jgi:hypothetical protein
MTVPSASNVARLRGATEAVETTEFGVGLRARLEQTGMTRDEGARDRVALEQNLLAAYPELRDWARGRRLGRRRRVPHFPLATLIFQTGYLTEAQLEDALSESEASERRLGAVLAARGWLHESEILRLLAEQRGLPYLDVGRIRLDGRAAAILPAETALRIRALPLGYLYGAPVVAIADPADEASQESIRSRLGTNVAFVVAAAAPIDSGLAVLYGQRAAAA